jgi:hypothetical protein
MIKIIVDAFSKANETTSALGGRVEVSLLYIVFDWVAYFYGKSDKTDTQGAAVPLTLDEAVRAKNLVRVQDLNQKRSFELSMSTICDSGGARRRNAVVIRTKVCMAADNWDDAVEFMPNGTPRGDPEALAHYSLDQVRTTAAPERRAKVQLPGLRLSTRV